MFSCRPTRRSPSPAVQRRPGGGEKPSRCRRRHHRPTSWSSCTLGCRPPPCYPRHTSNCSRIPSGTPPQPPPEATLRRGGAGGAEGGPHPPGERGGRGRGTEGGRKNDNARVLDIWVRSNGVERLLSGGEGVARGTGREKKYKTTVIHHLRVREERLAW